MNDYQEERHASNKLVVKIAKENPDIIKLIPDFEEGIAKQDEINNKIEKIRKLQEEDTSAVTTNKTFTIQNLVNQTLDVSGAVHAYADKKNDVLLMGKVDFKIGALSKMVPGKIIAAATTSVEEAKKIPPADLAKAGITAAELTAYEEIVDYFKSISASTREAQIETSGYTEQLVVLFKASTKLFKKSLDKLAHQFKTKAPEFYHKYRAARKAIHRGPDKPVTPGGGK